MKTYEFYVHWKQGDDFKTHVGQTANTAEALRQWAMSFESHRNTCNQLSEYLIGQDIEVQADTHMISFSPQNDAATEALEKAVAVGLLSTFDWDDEEDADE